MQRQPCKLPNSWLSRGLALLLTLMLALGLLQSAQAQTVTSGYVQGWGWNHVGQLDIPPNLRDVIAVAASQVHSMALKSDGTVVAWGSNVDGQTDIPAGLSNVIAIAAGGDHSLALKSNGTVVAWGSNETNQLDIPPGLNNVIAIAAGDFHSLALKSDGTVVAWGCGGGYDYDQCTVPAGALSGVVAIAAGAAHSLALKNTGEVVAWGINFQDQTAVPAGALSGVVAIAAGSSSNHSLALKSNGTVVAWGRNEDGQTDVPAGLSGVVAIATGYGHSLALKSDGTLVGWGLNSDGQTDVPDGLTGIIAMAGGWHTLVIVPPPSVTINQAAGQADPTSTNPILFTATFSKAVTDFTAADVTLSGTADLTNATITISGGPSVYTISVAGVAGSGTVIATIAADVATDANGYGNRASTSTDNSVTMDPKPPTITPNVVGTLGNNGWYMSNVTVSWTVAANGTTISSQTGCETQNITSDTSGVTFTCSATNAVGSSSESVTIKRDATAPAVSAAATSNPNAAGWYNSNVTVHFTCDDALSGVTSCPADQVLSNQGAAVASAAQTITDLAGNSSAPSNVVTVKIDKTAPTVSAAPFSGPNANGWYRGLVFVRFTCADNLAGVTSCPADQFLTTEGTGISSTAYTITDHAGNSSAPSNVITAKIDVTRPTISAAVTTQPNANGWYNSNVTVHFTCSDALSGVATCPADQIVSTEGSAVASTAQTATDLAGNTSTASNVVTVKIDKTAPVVTVTGVTNAVTYPADNPPTVGCSTSDALAGVMTQATLSVTGGNPDGTGRFTATCSAATDNAGNSGSASVIYTVGALAGGVTGWGSTNVPAGLRDVIAIAGGNAHSLALKRDGTVVAWGDNSDGQSSVPAGLSGVSAIGAGQTQSLAAKSDGTVVAWGCGRALYNLGQCDVPAGLSGAVAVAGGGFHSLALKSDGTVVAWGNNTYGQLNVPAGLNDVVAIAAGTYYSLALRSNGTMVAWGFSSYGAQNIPGGLNNVIAIAAFNDHSLALRGDGTVVAWGSNFAGESNVPTGLNNVVAIAGGASYSLAIVAAPTVAVEQAAGQADPTSSNPVRFAVLFNEPVTGFTAGDVTLSGTADLTGATITISGGPAAYMISVDGLTSNGTVIATVPANVATNERGKTNLASTSSDNTVTLNFDSTPPVITPNVVGTLGSNGWYTSDINITWSVVDNESAITNQTGCEAQSVTSDTTGVTFTCSATSAGGSNSQSVTIPRDATAPTITFVDRTAANSNGWNNGDVTVNWSCSDATSGAVTANVSQTVSSEGANQSATGACTDNAGNSASNTQSGINIDKTAPTISAAATTNPNAAGWYNSDVTVHFTCTDGLAGVTSCPAAELLSSEGDAVSSAAQTITDLAGNSSAASNVVTVKIDKTAPTISAAATTAPNASGWYNGDVTIHFTCADNLSGVTSCPADAVLSSEGSAVNSTAQTISDQAGNSSAASNVVTVKIDKTVPVVTVTGVSNGTSYGLGSAPTAGCNTTDALSGVATQATLNVTGGNPDGTGSFTATCSGATDNASNNGSASVSYSVAYKWTGFFQPVDNLPTVNTVNAGQAIPVKFSLGGDFGLNIFATGYPASQNVSCGGSGGGGTSPIEETVTAGSSSLQYDPGTQGYIYVWKTNKAWAGSCRQLIVKLIDGTDHIALFQFNGKARSADAGESDAEGEEAAARQQIFLPLVNR